MGVAVERGMKETVKSITNAMKIGADCAVNG